MYRSIIKSTILFLLVFTVSNTVWAQTLTIKSVSLLPNDKTAIEYPCFDINGDTCALLKIKTDNLDGIEFPDSTTQYIKATYSAGTYYVYIPALGRKLDLRHKDYLGIQIDMSNYGYKRLQKGKTYLVVIEAPKKTYLESSVVIKAEPKQSRIVFDGQAYETNKNGIVELPATTGNHLYEVSAPNYHTQKGTVSVGKSEAKTVSVRLRPITHEVLIKSNVKNASVFVDNINYGKVGKLLIPQGTHTIRVHADGYIDSERSISVNASTTSLSFVIEKNKRTTHIHPTPVTIFSYSSNIYKNGKKIKEWTNGKTIMFMPGKYHLSASNGTELIITVRSEPMTVNL